MAFEDIGLEPEQEELLAALVEAARNVPSDKRQPFLAWRGDDQLQLSHPGLAGRVRRVLEGDIGTLCGEGLVATSGDTYNVTPRGFRYYEELKRRSGQPVERLEREVRRYLLAEHFQQSYPKASRKWADAEAMLWATDSREQFSAIGLYCREAMQEFAAALVERYQPPSGNVHKASTVARLKAVLNHRRAHLGEAEQALLDALIAYWGTVSDLVQRQVHDAEREAEAVVWEDARRVVFQTAVVMYEVDKSLSRTS